MKRIVILEVCNNLSLGGTERAMQEFAMNLDKDRFEVLVAAYNTQGPRKAILESNGIEVVEVDDYKLSKLVKQRKVDIVHSHCIPVKQIIGECLNVHEVVFSGTFRTDADINLVISKTLALKISKVKHIEYGKDFYVLYYPQNVTAWDKHKLTKQQIIKARARFGFRIDSYVIGRIGRPEPSKTDFLLLASAPLIAKNHPRVRFLFVGLPLFYRLYLSLCPSLRGKVEYRQATPDDKELALYYQCMDLFWHTASRGETFGNVNAEAMIWNLPVLTHSTPFKGTGMKEELDNAQIEIVDHMKTGIVANHPNDVTEAVRILLVNPKLADKLGANGRAKVLQQYDAKGVIRQFEKLVCGLVEKRAVNIRPSKVDVDSYFTKEYNNRLKKSIDVSSKMHIVCYKIKLNLYRCAEFSYLAVRFALRKIGIDLETKMY